MANLSCMRSDYQCPMQRDVGFVVECVEGFGLCCKMIGVVGVIR
jgi:hypothetical protein